MSLETNTPVVETEKVKVERKELPELGENLVAINLGEIKPVVQINVVEAQEYAQIHALTKEARNVAYVSGNKQAMLFIEASEVNTPLIKKYINPEFDSTVTAAILATVTYGDYIKLRISAKNSGTSKMKVSARAAFWDRDWSGVVNEETYQYIYGIDGTEYTKEKNAIIVRLGKDMFKDHRLYHDHNREGFHKDTPRIPLDSTGVRTSDNYSFKFNWSDIELKIENFNAKVASGEIVLTEKDDAIVSGKDVVAGLIERIKAVYPNIEIDTSKPLYIETLKSAFAKISAEKLVFVDGVIISKAEELEKIKAEKAAEKERIKAEKEANKELLKAEKAAERAAQKAEETKLKLANINNTASTTVALEGVDIAPVAPIGVTPVAPVSPVAPVAPVSPVAPVAPIGVVGVAPVTLVAPVSLVNETPVTPVAVTPVVQ